MRGTEGGSQGIPAIAIANGENAIERALPESSERDITSQDIDIFSPIAKIRARGHTRPYLRSKSPAMRYVRKTMMRVGNRAGTIETVTELKLPTATRGD